MTVRPADPDDRLDVLRVLDGANLETDAANITDRIDDGRVLVAVDAGTVVGALVAAPATGHDGAHVESVAVRRRRRGQGVGTALVTAAAKRWLPLTAAFAPGVRAFYESLGFDVECGDGRCHGRLE